MWITGGFKVLIFLQSVTNLSMLHRKLKYMYFWFYKPIGDFFDSIDFLNFILKLH